MSEQRTPLPRLRLVTPPDRERVTDERSTNPAVELKPPRLVNPRNVPKSPGNDVRQAESNDLSLEGSVKTGSEAGTE